MEWSTKVVTLAGNCTATETGLGCSLIQAIPASRIACSMPLFLRTANYQKLEVGMAWEQGYIWFVQHYINFQFLSASSIVVLHML